LLHACLHVAILIWNYSELRRHAMTRRIFDQGRKDDALGILEKAKEAVMLTTKDNRWRLFIWHLHPVQ
jgi:hypothetical protein